MIDLLGVTQIPSVREPPVMLFGSFGALPEPVKMLRDRSPMLTSVDPVLK
jgi:hypothetical protein